MGEGASGGKEGEREDGGGGGERKDGLSASFLKKSTTKDFQWCYHQEASIHKQFNLKYSRKFPWRNRIPNLICQK